MKEKREEKRARRRASDPEELTKAHVPADMKERTSAEQSVSLTGAWRPAFKLLSKTGRRSARAFFVFLAIAIVWSAYPQDGNIRAQEPKPSFEHQVAYITARISIRPLGSVKKEMHGTGFFYRSNFALNDGSPNSRLLLISNKHVFVDPTSKMTITVNKKKDDGSPDFGNVASITFSGFTDRYYPHPDPGVDLACVDVTLLLALRVEGKPLYIKQVVAEFLTPINYEKVALGSDVLFIGYPNNFYDTRNNLPLARKGSLSSIPSVDFEGKGELVIDAEVFEGSSGSPVFIGWDRKYSLLGVLARSVVTKQLGGIVKEHIGLGLVVKQRHVKELIDYTSKMIRTKNEGKQSAEQSAPIEEG